MKQFKLSGPHHQVFIILLDDDLRSHLVCRHWFSHFKSSLHRNSI